MTFRTQSGGEYELNRGTISGGGGLSSGGDYVLIATIGQPEAGVMKNGIYSLFGGFWSSSAYMFEIYALKHIHGDISDTVTIEWYIKPGKNYRFYYTEKLGPNEDWQPISGSYTDFGETASQIDIINHPNQNRFYKVGVW